MKLKSHRSSVLTLILFLCLAPACSRDEGVTNKTDPTVTLSVWFHSGQESERQTIKQQVARFNLSHPGTQIELTFIPEQTYNAQVQAAALANELPDLLEFDGPYLYSYVWQGSLLPLDELIPASTIDDLLPSIIAQGTYQGKLYGIGTFDSGLGLYGRKSMLQAINARLPKSPDEAWSLSEFEEILAKLAEKDTDGAVLDLKFNYRGEWYTYAFSPAIQSAGGDLINRDDFQSAQGILNSPASVSALTHIQSWVEKKYIDPNVDDGAFTGGRVALSWVGHWLYGQYLKAAGDDLLVLPLPRFNKKLVTGQGSWCWGISRASKHPEKAAEVLQFLLQTEEVLAMAEANGAVPATKSAITQSTLYNKQGPLYLFAEQLQHGYAVPRPQTPAYPVITSAFQQAFLSIRNGKDVKQALDKAVDVIDRDINDNKGYKTETQ